MLKKCIFLILFSLFIFLIAGCKKDLMPTANSNSQEPRIQLTVEEVGVTEAWLHLHIQNKSSRSQIVIQRNDSTIKQFNNLTTDTLIYDFGLFPNQNHTYNATLLTSNQQQVSSIQLTTMDTTSHTFTWDTLFFGEGASSYFNDVAIINENDIWAVGKINAGYGNDPYNAVHWDGFHWELLRIEVRLQYNGTVIYTEADPIKSVFALSSNDIIFVSNAGGVTRYKDSTWIMLEFSYGTGPGGANKIWGFSLNDIYFAGRNGRITYYDGTDWRRIESGTDADISDIWGTEDIETGEHFILCAVSNPIESGERKILQIKNTTVVDTLEWNNEKRIFSTWFKNDNYIFTAGSGVFYRNKNQPWQEVQTIPWVTSECVRGNDINDIFVVGHFGLVAHFNGMKWKHYPELNFALYYSCSYKNNIMIAVGERNAKGVILKMKR